MSDAENNIRQKGQGPPTAERPEGLDAHLGRHASAVGLHQRDSVAALCRKNLLVMFPNLPLQSGYNKRLRKLAATRRLIGELGQQTSVTGDDVWVVDSTPVERARSRETVKRSDLAGWPSTATAPHIPGSSGGCGYIWILQGLPMG